MRLLGTLLLTGGAVLLGLSAAQRTKWRVRDLRMLVDGLRTMQRELSYRLAPLPELLCSAEEVGRGSVKQFFFLCAQGAERLNGKTFQSVWNQAIQDSRMCLLLDDLHCLEALGAVLGRYDSENQRQAIQTTISRLEELCEEAQTQSVRLGKLYSVLGLTVGAFLMILLV